MRRAALAPLLLVLAIAGCGSDSNPAGSTGSTGSSVGAPVTQTVQTTRVEIVKGIGSKGAFDPATIYKREGPGVVTVISVFVGGGGTGLLGGGGRGLGSGFVISKSGEIATNAHVVTNGDGAALRRAREVYVSFADGNQVPAKIIGDDPDADVALLKVDPSGLTLRPLPLGSSHDLVVGSPVAAIGSPFGEPQSLSVGVISATQRTIDSLTNFQISDAIQTDAAINRGNSGGPLVNAKGQVLGINSQIRSTGGGGEGVGLAVPVDTVRRSLDQLRRGGKVSYAFVGVSSINVFPQLARRFGLGADHGAWVQEVTRGGPAAKAGLRGGRGQKRFQAQSYSVGGDVITAVAGTDIRDDSDLSRAIAHLEPGRSVTVVYYRGRTRKSLRVKLAARPTGAPSPRSRP